MRIAIQGENGSFHDAAVRKFFDGKVELIPCMTFSSVFDQLRNSNIETGVVAVENSLYGSIHETFDQLVRYNFPIIGEIQLQIHQQLVGLPGSKLQNIKEVISHPAALNQCRNFIDKNLPKATVREHADTAGAVAEIHQNKLIHTAAIASDVAASLYDMKILAHNIEDEPDNITRFLVISRKAAKIDNANKASIILNTNHQPGALYRALGVFNQNNTNLTKLESRQVRGKPFEYQFIIDIETNQTELITVIHELEQLDYTVRLLGHYRSAN